MYLHGPFGLERHAGLASAGPASYRYGHGYTVEVDVDTKRGSILNYYILIPVLLVALSVNQALNQLPLQVLL